MGGSLGFRRALIREPLKEWHDPQGASGAHQHLGIETANVPWEIYVASSDGESVNVATWMALHSTIDIDGLYDILEMKQVHHTWASAAVLNARDQAERDGRNG